MPNHITNKISLDVAKLLTNSEGSIDFNLVLPMPESLMNPDPQQMEIRAKAAMGLLKQHPIDQSALECLSHHSKMRLATEGMFEPIDNEKINLLIQAIENLRDHGFVYWYPWAIKNWGTKWNAYSVEFGNRFCTFQTAWSHPAPVFKKLSEMNPDIEITVEYADEDIGSNCGIVTYSGGRVLSENIAPNWNGLNEELRDNWIRFALSITDPENIEERMAEYAEEQG